jgi:hypothetical protein
MKTVSTLLSVLLIVFSLSFAQAQKCKSHTNWLKAVENDPTAQDRMRQLNEFTEDYQSNSSSRDVITIPVVVHVLYNSQSQNISDAQINSQIDRLNTDFRKLNSDKLASSHPFAGVSADVEIEFCLAKQDPAGFAHSGINRVSVASQYFDTEEEDMKRVATGGVDNWDPTKYFNWWVVSFHPDSSTLAFATFPSELGAQPELDGVVFRHEVFGTTGTAGTGGFDVNDMGRTATHEVGHWLNLRHIWGDDYCGDDFVADTPEHEEENYDCPSFPSFPNNGCGTGANGEMYMNYMDYVDDNCMVMFTEGQSTRMNAALDGPRASLKTSPGCEPGIVGLNELAGTSFSVFPNPASELVTIDLGAEVSAFEVTIYDLTGAKVASQSSDSGSKMNFSLKGIAAGYYMLQVSQNGIVATSKLIVQ